MPALKGTIKGRLFILPRDTTLNTFNKSYQGTPLWVHFINPTKGHHSGYVLTIFMFLHYHMSIYIQL